MIGHRHGEEARRVGEHEGTATGPRLGEILAWAGGYVERVG